MAWQKATMQTLFNSVFPKWANIMNQNEKIVYLPGMSQYTVKWTLLCAGGFVSPRWEVSIFYLFVSHSIHYLTIAVSRAGSPGSTFATFFHYSTRVLSSNDPRLRPTVSILVSTSGTTAQRALYVLFFFLNKHSRSCILTNKSQTLCFL